MSKFVTTTYALKLPSRIATIRGEEQKQNFIERPLRIAFLTDLHNHLYEPDQRPLLKAIAKAQPDLVLCGGDMLVGKPDVSPEIAARLVSALTSDFPVYYALGNHEYRLKIYPETYGDVFERYRDRLAEAGVGFLDNETCKLNIRGIPVTLYGLSLDKYYYHRWRFHPLPLEEMHKCIGMPDSKSLTILLAHNPVYRSIYREWGADLTLSGHNHGGMIRFGKHKGLLSPSLRFFSDDCYGIFREGEQVQIIGAGLGEHTFPLRLHNPRELIILEYGE